MPSRPIRLALLVLLVVAVLPAAAGADSPPPGQATYHGRTIDLAESWEGAGACAVFADGPARCFDTYEQMEEATVGQVRYPDDDRPAVRTVQAADGGLLLAAACGGTASDWLYLYEHAGFAGTTLKFQDVSVWHNLPAYGFNDRTSSVWNATDCTAELAEHVDGGGALLVQLPNTSRSSMPSGWNDEASSVCLLGVC